MLNLITGLGLGLLISLAIITISPEIKTEIIQ